MTFLKQFRNWKWLKTSFFVKNRHIFLLKMGKICLLQAITRHFKHFLLNYHTCIIIYSDNHCYVEKVHLTTDKSRTEAPHQSWRSKENCNSNCSSTYTILRIPFDVNVNTLLLWIIQSMTVESELDEIFTFKTIYKYALSSCACVCVVREMSGTNKYIKFTFTIM